ncbi:MAG: hypothetical protein ABI818_12260 [Acidobacteriota bacterium]
MIWRFERGDEVVRVETRVDNSSGEYVVEVTWAGRQAETERFLDNAAFRTRILELESQLAGEHWAQVGGPEVLWDGWRGPVTN